MYQNSRYNATRLTMIYHPDCLIVGGGIAGLWLLSRLRDAGADAWLLEKNQLGSGQTLASQGIIHGGIKYSLSGKISGSTKAISAMPERWHQHMVGKQLPQLNKITLLSDKHYLISTPNMLGKMTRLLASKMLSGNNSIESLETLRLTTDMTGIALEENIIDTKSLIEILHQNIRHYCRQFCLSKQQLYKSKGHWSIEINGEMITPKLLIFAAGAGNSEFISNRKVQLRPLHMVHLHHKNLFPIYAHLIEPGKNKPTCTITTHYDDDNNLIWYLGGELAETGVELYSGQQCVRAEQILRRLWTHIDWGHSKWKSFIINRAEMKTRNLLRPESPSIHKCAKNSLAVFPTKLTFTPLLVDKILNEYQKLQSSETQLHQGILQTLPLAELGNLPWSTFR